MYRRESEEFDPDYLRKCRQDLGVYLTFVSCRRRFLAPSLVLIIEKLRADPNEINVAYLRSLIHTIDPSRYPDADPSTAVTEKGPTPGIDTVLFLLCANLGTLFFACFAAVVGREWAKYFIRTRRGSAAEKSLDRQQKLDKMGRRHFRVIMEGLPVMLQIVLVFLLHAVLQYLWTIDHAAVPYLIAIIAAAISMTVSSMIASGRGEAAVTLACFITSR
ncbi:hypothetical protein BDM02DRAFT_3187969 [Thelephora ganbajun]|uniref:Uncharacterized protein n=1 Tax=Thelephora ganbajun TaxID=370292 RepID=A0ACB6ZDF6_THEGA|nr:hypothetical protein BDM02DRAFT_3187969 [Thelephora ganbajun]